MTVADALQAAGVTVHDAQVPPRPGTWTPFGVLWHHVGDLPPAALKVPPPALKLCQDGRADLPGPLCQWLVDGDGGWWWITDGRANHAGNGDGDVHDWLLANPATRAPDPPRPDVDTDSGNGFLIGVEVEGNGNWSAPVHASMIAGTRALLAHYQLPVDSVIGHKEWTKRKPDPAGIDMAAARNALRNPQPQPEDQEMLIYFSDEDVDGLEIASDHGNLTGLTDERTRDSLIHAGFVKVAVSGEYFALLKSKTTR